MLNNYANNINVRALKNKQKQINKPTNINNKNVY